MAGYRAPTPVCGQAFFVKVENKNLFYQTINRSARHDQVHEKVYNVAKEEFNSLKKKGVKNYVKDKFSSWF
ncbi:hypothetical protein [Melghirimyces algeriensis]|uniref:Uncharacterized protein n=1 Tax=Melghirimyces algeriensis TaxID=910412 RepID=A0A521E8Z0_9BACL|nr:hypothetical protein [Melghirimyces algeriensis]SMO80387.1 hypothetical protein SAMN06264849_108107 [Melghirimyces algeriensis]